MTLTHQNIKLNKNYVICRTIDGIYKEQVVIIDGKEETEKDIYYSYNYGIFGFHEGFSVFKNIRKLTSQEENDRQKGHYWKLPQQFYQ